MNLFFVGFFFFSRVLLSSGLLVVLGIEPQGLRLESHLNDHYAVSPVQHFVNLDSSMYTLE